MIDLRLIRNFEAVYRLGRFSKAATSLGITQSALTKSIQSLEFQWGVSLFHRTTRQVAPTEAGRRLYPLSLELLAMGQTVRAQTIGGTPHLRLISGPAVLETLIIPAITAFRQTHPEVKISVETMRPDMAIEELMQRRVQAVIYHSRTLGAVSRQRDLTIREVFREPYVVAHDPAHPAKGCGSLETLLGYDWAVAGFDAVYETNLPAGVRQMLMDAGFPKYRLLSQAACLDLSVGTDILTAAPQSAVAPWLAAGRLATTPYPGGLQFSVSLATVAPSQTDPALEAFVQALAKRPVHALAAVDRLV